MNEIECEHYKKEEDGYTYKLPKQIINLCRFCEMHLLADMKKQEVFENKMQTTINENLNKKINKELK